MKSSQINLIILLILVFAIFACEKDPTSSKDDETITDIDGNIYTSVIIGEQEWMVENLKVIHYRNGDLIPNVTDDSEWHDLTAGAYCNYDNDVTNADTYGRLYNWFAVNDNRNIAPVGWHIPSDDEWKTLEMFLGMSGVSANLGGYRGTDEGGKLKETGNTHWNIPNTGATNESGFTALPAGLREQAGIFHHIGNIACFWTSSEDTSISNYWAYKRQVNYLNSYVQRSSQGKQWSHSVRCVRN